MIPNIEDRVAALEGEFEAMRSCLADPIACLERALYLLKTGADRVNAADQARTALKPS